MADLVTKRWTYSSILPLFFGILLSFALYQLARDQDEWATWVDYLPYGQWPMYGDLAVTLEHLSQAAKGEDPLSDPESEFGYPRAVLSLHHLGIQHVPANWLGLLQSLLVVGGIVFILRPKNRAQSIAVSLIFIAPPIVLGFERANLDCILFLLCAGCASAWARSQSTAALTFPILGLTIAAVSKLHPVFALIAGAFVERGRRRIVWILGFGLLLGFWAFTWADFSLIAQKVPASSTWGSWGCVSFFARVERFVESREAYRWLADTNWQIVAVLTYAFTGAVAFALGTKLSKQFASIDWEPRECAYFWIGAAICCGSFAGANIAYRWIFVLLTIPLLARAAFAPVGAVVLWSRLALAAIAMSLAAPLHAHRGMFIVTQFANWTGILLLIAGCAAMRNSANPYYWRRQVGSRSTTTARGDVAQLST